VHPTEVGPDNASLSIDLAILAPAGARSLLIITSGTHGVALYVLKALRADHWLRRHPECEATAAAQIRQILKDAFYCDNDEWKRLVFGQTRVVAWQAIAGLSEGDAEVSGSVR
jgi:hypothetical protein